MPLSEHEQRILAQLEESLSKEDPRFAKSVRETTVYTHSGRRVRWGAAGFVGGLVLLLVYFASNIESGMFCVVIMFVSAVVVESNARRMGGASWHDFSRSMRRDVNEDDVLAERPRAIREWWARHRRPQ